MGTNNATNGMLGTVTSTARSSGGAYALTATSNYYQIFTGNNFGTLDVVTLPDTSTLQLGRQFFITTDSNVGNMAVNTNDGSEIIQLSFNRIPLIVTCISTASNDLSAWSCYPMNSNNYSFNPVVSFATPGDLSVSYSSRTGLITRIGSLLRLQISLRFTPTYTTASGRIQITGMPINFSNPDTQGYPGILGSNGIGPSVVNPFAFPSGCTMVVPYATAPSGNDLISLRGFGSGTVSVDLTTAQFPSGSERYFRITIVGPDEFS